MTRDIKFTAFGIPYVVEFENVSVVPERRRHVPDPSPSSSTSSFCYIDSPPPVPHRPSFSLPSPSFLFKRKPAPIFPTMAPNNSIPEPPLWCANAKSTKPLPPPPKSNASEAHGIRIRVPPECNHPQMTRKERLVHLQQTISISVLDAGMSRSPGSTTHPNEHSNGNTVVHTNRGYKTPNALFCGTYGQLMAALEVAGLSATPCTEENSPGHTRLGALFVARNDGASGVQLRKITLWADLSG